MKNSSLKERTAEKIFGLLIFITVLIALPGLVLRIIGSIIRNAITNKPPIHEAGDTNIGYHLSKAMPTAILFWIGIGAFIVFRIIH